MATMDNLAAAFAGESQANRRYLAFAKKAEAEGFLQAAKLFRAAAAAETVHAHNHLGVAGGISDTEANLKAAIKGETFEYREMYPGFIAEAGAADEKRAKWSFEVANKVEEIHAGLFEAALSAMSNAPGPDYYVCEVCGNTVAGGPEDKCSVCGAPKEKFMRVE